MLMCVGITFSGWGAWQEGVSGESSNTFRSDASASFDYTWPSKLHLDSGHSGDLDTLHYRLGYMANIPINEDWQWRIGLEYSQFSFSTPDEAPLPNTLRGVAVPIGISWRLNEDWQVRFQMSPGVYSDFKDISADDVYVPVMAAGTYKINRDLQVVGGLAIEPRRDIPVLPFAGVRWHFADHWNLSLLFPRSGIEYTPWKAITFFGGADLRGGAFQVNEHFGDKFGRPDLNNESLTYWEIRAGVGVRYRLAKRLSAEVGGGWAIDRRFVFREPDFTVRSDGAPYIQSGLNFSF